jgi:hypothetical protein
MLRIEYGVVGALLIPSLELSISPNFGCDIRAKAAIQQGAL